MSPLCHRICATVVLLFTIGVNFVHSTEVVDLALNRRARIPSLENVNIATDTDEGCICTRVKENNHYNWWILDLGKAYYKLQILIEGSRNDTNASINKDVSVDFGPSMHKMVQNGPAGKLHRYNLYTPGAYLGVRFIILSHISFDSHLEICDVKAICDSECMFHNNSDHSVFNTSLNKKAEMSSVEAGEFSADKAVNGMVGECARTKVGVGGSNLWTLDLGTAYYKPHILIESSGNDTDESVNIDVSLSLGPSLDRMFNYGPPLKKLAHYHLFTPDTMEGIRFISLTQVNTASYLEICEVKVFLNPGCALYNDKDTVQKLTETFTPRKV